MIQTILFDFDGTLFDTGEGILRSVQYALEGFGIHETDTARLRKFVGPPLFDSFSELYAMTPEQAQAAVARYRERYLPVGIYECTLYPGIPELLEQLRAHGFRVAVATGKPTPMACSILQRFDLERLFDCVIGVFLYDGSAYLKQLRRDGGRVFLHSLNPAYADLEVSDALPLRVLGKAVS